MYYIYELKNENGLCYYGMTTDYEKRYKQHRVLSNPSSSRLLFQNDSTVEIKVLNEIEDYETARHKELYYILKNPCVNVKIPFRDRHQYKIDNREQILRRTLTPIPCECGCMITRKNMARHLGTRKHFRMNINNVI
jgi:predicted GIY-YIG superfamily endonuclease